MSTVLLIIAAVLVLFSFYGLMASLLRFAAVACLAAGLWYWSQGDRAALGGKLQQGLDQLIEKGRSLSANDRELLRKALQGADTLLEGQRQQLRALVEELGKDPALKQQEDTNAVLEQLRDRAKP